MDMNKNKRILGVIPARLKSQRLPNKIIKPIKGKALINYTYENALNCSLFDDVVIGVDNEIIINSLEEKNKKAAIMTSPKHPSGTDRIIEIMEKKPEYDYYINIQGDEPLIPMATIRGVIQTLDISETDVATAAITIKEPEDYYNINIVKVIFDHNHKALYFSRAPIPYDRNNNLLFQNLYPYKHIGIYGYTKNALEKIKLLKENDVEKTESLEQLRFLMNGLTIRIFITSDDSIGVDTENDFKQVEKILLKK